MMRFVVMLAALGLTSTRPSTGWIIQRSVAAAAAITELSLGASRISVTRSGSHSKRDSASDSYGNLVVMPSRRTGASPLRWYLSIAARTSAGWLSSTLSGGGGGASGSSNFAGTNLGGSAGG